VQVLPGDTLSSIATLYFTNTQVLMQVNPCENDSSCVLQNEADALVPGSLLNIGRLAPVGGKTLDSVLSDLGISDRLPLISMLNPGTLVPTRDGPGRLVQMAGNAQNQVQAADAEFCITTDNIQN
jgi:hypothetical protein